ncbi:hypothetical protein CFY87_02215 [Actinobacillus seminis]|uniref:Uncharacterized protein n=1 Tax=Actinobacillus seminis TaxID=722 RepID=A0A263HEC7_9PAST|nr:hypothetical protein [Actinobacillus seminis]OZN25442.1 hypothetical protein CFY87_02215 [Actinobacillus seminis]SUU38060.1 Uncharacterised protein [Actinobacillus seminis]
MLMRKIENGKCFYTDMVGNKYQYDLSDLSDQLSYKMDLDAQMRDQLSVNPTRNKNGGGIYE